jgi:hypothetical protein
MIKGTRLEFKDLACLVIRITIALLLLLWTGPLVGMVLIMLLHVVVDSGI